MTTSHFSYQQYEQQPIQQQVKNMPHDENKPYRQNLDDLIKYIESDEKTGLGKVARKKQKKKSVEEYPESSVQSVEKSKEESPENDQELESDLDEENSDNEEEAKTSTVKEKKKKKKRRRNKKKHLRTGEENEGALL